MPFTAGFSWGRTMLCAAGLFSLTLFAATALAAPPVVSNIRAAQRAGTHLVDIYYNVADADGNSPLTVYVAISANGGVNYNVPVFTLTGAVGPGVTLGTTGTSSGTPARTGPASSTASAK